MPEKTISYAQKKKLSSYRRPLKSKRLSQKARRSFGLLSLIMISATLISACFLDRTDKQNSQFDFGNPAKLKRTVLDIEGSRYRNSDFEKYLQLTVGEDYKSLPAVSLSRLFDGFVEEKILLTAADKNGQSLSDQEKEDYLRRLDEEVFSEEQNSFAEEDIEFFFERLLIDKYSLSLIEGLQVTSEELQAYYEQNKKEFLRPERVKVSQILLDSEERAIAILEQLKNKNEQEFRKSAQEASLGVEAQKGGEMGVFEIGQLPFEMEEVIFALEEGELSKVIESTYGYHIFRLDNKYEPELISIENAVPSLKMKVTDFKMKQIIYEHIETQKNTLEWKSYIQNLSFPYERDQDE